MITLYNDDCLNVMQSMQDNFIDCVITSPPYYNAMEYSHYNTYEDYLMFLNNVFSQVYRVVKSGHMVCVNISNVIEPRKNRNSESIRYPIAFHFVCLMEKLGFKFLEDIIWVKPSGSAKNRNGGFFRHRKPIAYKPNVINEYILVFQKPNGKLIDDVIREYDNSVVEESLVTDNGYEKTNVWYMNTDTTNSHPAPFPRELSDKLVKYYTYVGDTVMDPFMGSGTTGVSCYSHKRNFIGIEMNDTYFSLAKDRVTINKVELF